MRSDYAELMEQLKELGLNSWGNKNAYITFSHSGGSTHIGPVAEFFKRATNLAEKAAEAIAALSASAKPEASRVQEPVAWYWFDTEGLEHFVLGKNKPLDGVDCSPLYATPPTPQRDHLARTKKTLAAEKKNKELQEKLLRSKEFNYPMASKYGGEDW